MLSLRHKMLATTAAAMIGTLLHIAGRYLKTRDLNGNFVKKGDKNSFWEHYDIGGLMNGAHTQISQGR